MFPRNDMFMIRENCAPQKFGHQCMEVYYSTKNIYIHVHVCLCQEVVFSRIIEDICDVLKELQLLSTSLLDMRTVT